MSNEVTYKGLNAAGTEIAKTFDSKGLIVSRVNAIVKFLGENPTVSQNKALAALADSIESKVDLMVTPTGFKAANLGHYARVAKVLDDLNIVYSEAVIMAVYRLQLNARDALDTIKIRVASDIPSTQPAKRAALLVKLSAESMTDLQTTRNIAKAEKEAALEEAKALKAASKESGADSGEAGDDTVAKVLEPTTAADVAKYITTAAEVAWSPEDARTILAALNAASARMVDLTSVTVSA